MSQANLLARAKEVLRTPRRIAVLGVSRDSEKYGHEVFEVLRDGGHEVWPINPKIEEVEGVPCYPSLDALPSPPEVIVVALNPAVTEKVAPSCAGRGALLWLPPGCFTAQGEAAARAGGAEVLADICPVFAARALAAES